MNFVDSVCNFLNIVCASDADASLDPIYSALTTIGPYAMAVVLVLGMIYGIILGVKFAKTEDSGKREDLKKALINGIVGFLVVLMLIIILYAIREPLARWMNG